MDVNVTPARRTQADRTAATREALISAARQLFAEHGYAQIGTERVAQAAGVTRGALYHQFSDKAELFAAVLEAVEVDLTTHLIDVVSGVASDDPLAALVAGVDAWLDASTGPEVRQIVLLDGPAVLGWERWRAVGERYGLGLVTGLLSELMEAEAIPQQPVEALAHVLIGALDEAVLFIALAADPVRARADVATVLHRLVMAVTTQA